MKTSRCASSLRFSRAVVAREFGQRPKTIQLSFALDAGTTAQAMAPNAAR